MASSEGEKLLSNSRRAAQALSGELRIMAWRMRGILNGVKVASRYQRRDWETDIAHLTGYCKTIEKLCADHADRIDTHDRLVIHQLHNLAQMVRENDY